MRGGPAEYHCLLCLCLSVPLVWWQLINWMMYLVTKPAPLDENPDVDREALNILEPQVGDRRTVGGIASLVVGVASGILLWLFELLCLLGFYWNTPSLTTPTYLARLGAISGITDELNRSLDWGFDFENGANVPSPLHLLATHPLLPASLRLVPDCLVFLGPGHGAQLGHGGHLPLLLGLADASAPLA